MESASTSLFAPAMLPSHLEIGMLPREESASSFTCASGTRRLLAALRWRTPRNQPVDTASAVTPVAIPPA